MFRAIGFVWQERFPEGKHYFSKGQPFGQNYGADAQKIVEEIFGRTAVYVSGSDIANKSKDEDAIQYVESQLKASGAPKEREGVI